jgi:hypothetical protein
MNTDNARSEARPKVMRSVRTFAVPMLIAWLLLTVALNVLVPPIESVARNHEVMRTMSRTALTDSFPAVLPWSPARLSST